MAISMNPRCVRLPAVLLVLLATFVTTAAVAQPPRIISYQGLLRDASGPVAGSHSITVNLYDAAGTPLFSETHNVIIGAEGVFDVLIGSVMPLPDSLSFDEEYWLGIVVDSGPEMTPRVRLAAAPYALNTTSVNGVSGRIVLQGKDGITIGEAGDTVVIGSATRSLRLPYADSADATEAAFSVTSTGAGRAGLFRISGPESVGPALEGITNSQRDAGGLPYNGVSGVLGRVDAAAGATYAAGVRGVNACITSEGAGVVGYQAGSGWGVYGEVHDSGIGVYGYVQARYAIGVRGEAVADNAVGVNAVFSGPEPGTALAITNGAVSVTGANRPGFVHLCTAANRVDSNITQLDYPLLNRNANAVIVVTHQLTVPQGGGRPVYHNAPIGVYYDAFRERWQIHYENGATIPLDSKFNVWVVNSK